jgi:hypothetical protein
VSIKSKLEAEGYEIGFSLGTAYWCREFKLWGGIEIKIRREYKTTYYYVNGPIKPFGDIGLTHKQLKKFYRSFMRFKKTGEL